MVAVVALVATAAGLARLGFGTGGDVLIAVGFFGALALMYSLAAHAIVQLVRRAPSLLLAVLVGVAVAAAAVLSGLLGTPFVRPLALVVLALAAWVGAAIGRLIALPGRHTGRGRGFLHAGAAITVALVTTILLVTDAGPATRPLFGRMSTGAELLTVPDPSRQGPHEVARFTYGSGTDHRRAEYGPHVVLRSPTVDLEPFIRGFAGWQSEVHEEYWGFDLTAVPLNAHVWMPRGPGPFPVVLVLHGNSTDERSEVGYAYLATLLATRGYAVVAIDENFLNGPWINAGEREVPARAWLALRHLELLRDWNAGTGSPFAGTLDLSRVALLGHSRGGEAAAIAGVFNTLRRYPDDASVPLRFGFGIRAVVALAPTDQLYNPAGRAVAPSGISYLVLQGSQDADLSAFRGTGQYQRVAIPSGSGAFKAAVYVHGANHTQFNERWGDADRLQPVSWLLSRDRVLPAEQQRRIAAVYVAAFLEATIRGDSRYRPLFGSAAVASHWLPATEYVSRYDDGLARMVATFEEDADPTTMTIAGASAEGHGLAIWREEQLRLRDRRASPQQNTVACLGWRAVPGAEAPAYEITFREPLALFRQGETAGSIVLAAASAVGDGAMDFTIELISANGATARVPLSRVGLLSGPREAPIWNAGVLDRLMVRGPEHVLQTFEIPITEFAGDAAFDAASVTKIRIVFDRVPAGAILLDDIGLRASLQPVP